MTKPGGLVTNYKAFRGQSFGAILDMNKGAGLGFDIMRLGLAAVILLSHTSGITGNGGVMTGLLNMLFQVTPETAHHLANTATTGHAGGHKALTGLGRPITLSYVPMFFALSGFLVTASAFRNRNVLRFLGLRLLRLLPALCVEIVLSALILGAFFTTLPLGEYFRHPTFHAYFLNILGIVHYKLPGVFIGTSGTSNVNSNLWTLPAEFHCYLILSVLIFTTLLFKRTILTAVFVVATIALLIGNSFYGLHVTPAQLAVPSVTYYFFVGLMFYLFRSRIIFHEGIFIACVVLCYPLMMFNTTVYVYPIMLTYITVFIGLFPFPQFKLLKSGDYSYGMYLYGYPVTQALVAGFPVLRGNLPVTAVLALVTTGLFAAFSWHCIEKHCLKLKKYISPKSSAIQEKLHPDALATSDAPPAPLTGADLSPSKT